MQLTQIPGSKIHFKQEQAGNPLGFVKLQLVGKYEKKMKENPLVTSKNFQKKFLK